MDIIRRAQLQHVAPVNVRPVSLPTFAPSQRTLGSARVPASNTVRKAQSLPGNPSGSGTGINPWWRYQEENVPGAGHIMVNVGTGNMVLQDGDMSVPHKGIAMAFRRTYNSQSLHDVNGDDGGQASMFGNGWTNNFDAHLTGANGTINVWDINGAEYVYTQATNGTWQSQTPGQHGTLASDGNCGMLWTKKSGTTYYFWDPYAVPPCSASYTTYGGFAGRLSGIIGRNSNVVLTLEYTWDNGITSSAGKVSQIAVKAESGMTSTLGFTDVNGHRLLQELTFPDGRTTVTYGYDSSGDLIQVTPPANNASGTNPTYTYGYGPVGSGTVMGWAASPRYYAGCATSCGSGGEALFFGFLGSSTATSTLGSIVHYGVVNPSIADGTGAALQAGYSSAAYAFLTEYYSTGGLNPTYQDTDGHMTTWVFDALGRPARTQQCTASSGQGAQCTGLWLVSTESWDASDNRISDVDPRGYETDYAYDTNGNTIAVAEPADAAGGSRPTRLLSYDSFNNVTRYCDQSATAQLGLSWTGRPAANDSLCPVSGYARQYAYDYPTYQTYGRLTSSTTPTTTAAPSGYTQIYAYASNQSGALDYGLPLTVTGAAFSERSATVGAAAVTITPQQTFTYDTNGNLLCYSKGSGTWVLTFDGLGRPLSIADPDDASSGTTCGRTPGLPGSTLKTSYTYFADGSKATSATPSESAAGVSTTMAHDLDGDEISETHHYSGVAGTTTKWYDGVGRLVEVQYPHDPTDFYSFPWTTRYLYDLTQNGQVWFGQTDLGNSLGPQPYAAYGGLYKTQEYLSSWYDLSGTAADALGRPTAKYKYGNGGIAASVETYDASGQLGLLHTDTNAVGDVKTLTYTNRSLLAHVGFSGSLTPARTYTYDPNGRITNINSAVFGNDTRQYDFAGELISRSEPTAGGITDPVTLQYSYLPNGWKAGLGIVAETGSAPGYGSSAKLYQYRTDGELVGEGYTYSGTYYPFTSVLTAAGRVESSSDPYGASSHRYSYDNAARVINYTTPGFTLSQENYDAEGELSSFAGYGTTVAETFNIRGELIAQEWGGANANACPTSPGWFKNQSANGILVGTALCAAPAASFDALAGVITGTGSSPDGFGQAETSTYYTFDAAGRKTGDSSLTRQRGTDDIASSSNRSNDVEDHVAEVDYYSSYLAGLGGPPQNFSANYQWGPNGHPALIGRTSSSIGGSPIPSGFEYQTLHWDGDSLLFVSDSTGGMNTVKFDTLGAIWPRGGTNALSSQNPPALGATNALVVYDYDFTGTVANERAGAGSNPVPVPPSSYQFAAMNGSFSIDFASAESFTDGVQTIQGVRTLEAGAQQWTTPDAYAGDIHDPMSQKPYMWNGNNPYTYSDPTGFEWESINGIPAEALYRAFGNANFAARWQAIAADPHPFTLSLKESPAMKTEPGTIGTTETQYDKADGTLVRVDISIRPSLMTTPGEGLDAVTSTIFHEVGGHGYNDITGHIGDEINGTAEPGAYAYEKASDEAVGLGEMYRHLHIVNKDSVRDHMLKDQE